MSKPRTIVCVDDDSDDLEILREAFGTAPHYHLVLLNSGKELFAFLKDNHDDVGLIVLDINLPVQNGIELLKQLQSSKDFSTLPVVMFTTGANSPQANQLQQMNIPVIEKPATFQEMLDVVSNMTGYCVGKIDCTLTSRISPCSTQVLFTDTFCWFKDSLFPAA